MWLIGLAFTCGVALVLVACTVHNRCSSSDPACIYHSYTLVQRAGPAVLGFVGAPAVISLIIAGLLRFKVRRRSTRADRAAWSFAVLSFIICIVGLAVEGFLMLLEAALTIGAVIATPVPHDSDDRLLRLGEQGWQRPRPPD